MQVLLAPIEDVVLGEKTMFSSDEAAGQTVLSVTNPQGFAANKHVILDVIGSEKAELLKVSSTSTNTITLTTATVIAHDKDAPIQLIRYDQRKFYRSTTETGTFAHLSAEGSPINIEVDNPEGTMLEDSTGTSTSWYKSTYFNTVTQSESALADAIAVKAGDADHYTSIYKIKVESGFQNNAYIGSDLVDRYRTEAEAQAEGAVIGLYSLPFSSTPKIFQHIVTLLAAGLLLSKEYGLESDVEVSKTGQRKIERAEELLEKIRDSKIRLVGEDGSEVDQRSGVMASSNNTYDEDIEDTGEMFNLSDEHFKLTDPTDPLADSRRSNVTDVGLE